MSERIGFLGLGIMGSRMAANIARAGFELTVWTHTPGKAAAWAAEHGGKAVLTPAQVAARSEILITMVVDGEQVEAVLLGDDGVVAGASEGSLCIDSSTIAPVQTRRLGAVLASRGIAMMDAPVSGSAPRAEDGTLTIMAGGGEREFKRALPVLEAMGSLVVHVGPLGQGEMVKLLNNALGAANATALAEALLVADATGVDLNAFERVVAAGSGASAQLELKAGAMRAHDFATLFKGEHMLKDVRLCLQEAKAAKTPFPAAAHAGELLAATVDRGLGQRDYAALIEAAESVAGRRLPESAQFDPGTEK